MSEALQGLSLYVSRAENQIPRHSVLVVDNGSGCGIQNQSPTPIVMVLVEVEHVVQRASDYIG